MGAKKAERAAPLTEHTALREAADVLSATVPQNAATADKRGLHTVVFGGRDEAERAAASAYLIDLGPQARAETVFADAARVLAAGRMLASAGMTEPRAALSSGDVRLLEDAITEVQRSRRLLTTALKLLREDGAPLTKSEIRELGDGFVATARDIGEAADRAAARGDADLPIYADRPSVNLSGY